MLRHRVPFDIDGGEEQDRTSHDLLLSGQDRSAPWVDTRSCPDRPGTVGPAAPMTPAELDTLRESWHWRLYHPAEVAPHAGREGGPWSASGCICFHWKSS